MSSFIADILGISPLKSHSLKKSTLISSTASKLRKSFDRQKKIATDILEIDEIEQINQQPSTSQEDDPRLRDYETLMCLLKEKLDDDSIKSNRKIQLLTIAPFSWSRKKISEYFNVSEYMVKEARKITKNEGILELPQPKKGKLLHPDIIRTVEQFYEDDEYTKLMPGRKDCVSIARNVYKQKRLLLCNLNELYAAYKAMYPENKIGLSKFCSLRPKWCVTVNSSGSHSVCVCSIHQNTKLIADSFSAIISERYSYKDLMSYIVCDIEDKNCMMHRCDKCPGKSSLKKFIEEKFQEINFEDEISYKQWESTDRTILRTITSSCDEFIDALIYEVDKLTKHSFISRSQAQYLKKLKKEIDGSTCIVLLDFAENYHYVIQDEVQSYHWNRDQCTIHPVICYYLGVDGFLASKSLCFISDDLLHDTSFVHEVQRQLCDNIKECLPHIRFIHYFSDGCTAQYKNYKNFMNLCYHKVEFDLDASWSFFATSHGKSPCDGIGGTVKRSLARSSLQNPVESQILTFIDVIKFSECITGITFFTIAKENMISKREYLDERYSL